MYDAEKKSAKGIKPNLSPYRVLIVDDSTFMIKQLSQIFVSECFEIAGTATDGTEGFEKYKELRPYIDFVTLDITMPKGDGITTLEHIIQFDETAIVIMSSALGMEDVVKKCLMLGAKGYIKKPLNREKVLDRVTAVLQAAWKSG